MAGKDAQLDTAIRTLMEKIESRPLTLPARPPLRPAYPPEGR
jgi:hypothetical protein